MRSGTISVVIPAYNAARYLPEAIASAQSQTRAPLEIIVVDDCSSDESAAVAAKCGARVLSMPVNSGPSATRNAGICAAAGAYIALLDADDRWTPDHCEVVAGLLDAHPAAAVAHARARILDPRAGCTVIPTDADTPEDVYVPLFRRNLVAQTTAVVRREVLSEVGGYDASLRYAEDYDLWLRIARTRTFVCTHAVTAVYRVHAEQASRSTDQLAAGAWGVRRRHFERLLQDGDRATADAVAVQLRSAFDDELRWAWDAHDVPGMQAVFAAEAWVPGAPPIAQRWRRRLGPAEPLWRLATRARSTVRQRICG